jgi:hypothetical protein
LLLDSNLIYGVLCGVEKYASKSVAQASGASAFCTVSVPGQ